VISKESAGSSAHGDRPGGARGAAEDAADWELIRLVGTGDTAALDQLYRSCHGFLYRFVYRVTRRPECCEEVINDVMFTVWQKAASTVPGARASTWILGIAHNMALKAVGRMGRSARLELALAELDEGFTPDIIHAVSTASLADKALAALSPEQRAVMELVYHHGLHYQEIAVLLECPESTVKTRVFHARRHLRALWPGLVGDGVVAKDSEAQEIESTGSGT
jgi:RNA polymerase sigma factor (sigma-70 family)